ncbi:MAG: Gfo/Idh/MocA family protein, partial [Deinococcus sp.]
AAALRTLPGVTLLGVSEPDPGRADRFARASGLNWRSQAELLFDRPDGVIVCAENARRLEPVRAAAAAGAHILCEKPIATTLEDAREMQSACEAAGVSFVTAFPARFSRAAQGLREELVAGGVGEVLGYSGVNHSVCPDPEFPWFSDPLLAGGGSAMDHIVHLADLLRFLGERPTSVYAALRPVPAWVRPGHAGVDAAGLVSLGFASGACASIDCSWSRPPGYPRWGQLRLEVMGTGGMLGLDPFAEHLNLSGAGHSWAGYGDDLNRLLLQDFLALCRGAAPSGLAANWTDGYEALRVVLAAYASAASGVPVELPGEE